MDDSKNLDAYWRLYQALQGQPPLEKDKPELELLLAPDEVSNILDIPEQAVLELAERREVASIKINGEVRFRRSDIEEALEAYRTPAIFEMA
jgi:excisionase family DNA binding protein